MSNLRIRKLRFDFDDEVPFNWNPGNPAFSTYMNIVSIIAICFEKMVVAAVKEAMPLLADPEAAEEADLFLRQEAQHAAAHRKHVRALIRHHPGLQHTLDEAIAAYDELTASTPLRYRLAYIADLEATFTPFFTMMLDHETSLFRPGDDRVASLLVWHFVEEVEHRSSALVVYDAVVADPFYRTRVLPRVVAHLFRVTRLLCAGINAHVPPAERAIDAHTIRPLPGMIAAIRNRPGPAGGTAIERARPAFAGIGRRTKLRTARRVLLSQNPFHDPAREPLPEFADRWFERFARGEDVCHWYSSSPG
ncbi:metal-dependent hydrolase [Nocardia sp. NPDC052254]|uniref:metal-dependent hydrolase n=1 Tax=Nocardia sp. NPDC052254 TaxID=3155681 RepID=UPI00343DAC61